MRDVGQMVNASIQHAVKHKGGGLMQRAEDQVNVSDTFNEYETAALRFKKSAKAMTAMKLSMEFYQKAIEVTIYYTYTHFDIYFFQHFKELFILMYMHSLILDIDGQYQCSCR